MSAWDLFEPPLCRCGHYTFIHWENGRCPGWSHRRLRLGPFSLAVRCQCRKPKTPAT